MSSATKLSEIGGVTVGPSSPTAHEIWTTLSAVNVNDQIKKKGGLSYLSWPFAYAEVMKEFPDFMYTFSDDEFHPDGSCTTHVNCWVGDVRREMWLPVMDNRNNAIKAPNARDISDTKMRCLVKCIAMFGLGHYIYAGEDLPVETTAPAGAPAPPKEVSDKLKAVALTLNTFIEDVTNRDELKKYWIDNKVALKELETDAPTLFEEVLTNFKAEGAKIAEATEGK